MAASKLFLRKVMEGPIASFKTRGVFNTAAVGAGCLDKGVGCRDVGTGCLGCTDGDSANARENMMGIKIRNKMLAFKVLIFPFIIPIPPWQSPADSLYSINKKAYRFMA